MPHTQPNHPVTIHDVTVVCATCHTVIEACMCGRRHTVITVPACAACHVPASHLRWSLGRTVLVSGLVSAGASTGTAWLWPRADLGAWGELTMVSIVGIAVGIAVGLYGAWPVTREDD